MTKEVILQTEKWVRSFVIAYNICPFAKAVVENNSLHYAVDNHQNMESCLQQLILECERLDEDSKTETTLIIYPDNFHDFETFLDYLECANELLALQNYEGIYQLASFHPEYCFADIEVEDASNYTNRSPFPMLHLIRESSLEHALKFYPNPHSIPENNINLTRSLGVSKLQALLVATKK